MERATGFFPWTFENYYFPGESKLDVNSGLKSTPPHRDRYGLSSCHNRTFKLQWICPSKKMQHPHSSFFSSQRLCFCASTPGGGGNAPSSPQTAEVQLGGGMQEGRARLYFQVFGTKSDLLKA